MSNNYFLSFSDQRSDEDETGLKDGRITSRYSFHTIKHFLITSEEINSCQVEHNCIFVQLTDFTVIITTYDKLALFFRNTNLSNINWPNIQ